MTPRARTFLIRRLYKQGFTDTEIAHELGCNSSTVFDRTHRWRVQDGVSGSGRGSRTDSTRAKYINNIYSVKSLKDGANERADLVDLLSAPKSRRQLAYWHGGDE